MLKIEQLIKFWCYYISVDHKSEKRTYLIVSLHLLLYSTEKKMRTQQDIMIHLQKKLSVEATVIRCHSSSNGLHPII